MWSKLNPSKLRNVGGRDESDLGLLVYGRNGKLWPRIAVLVTEGLGNDNEPAIRIGVSRKESAGSVWREVPLPSELVGDLHKLLVEVEGKLNERAKKVAIPDSTASPVPPTRV